MSGEPTPRLAPLAVAEIERRLQWRAGPSLAYVGVMVVFLGAALWPTLVPAPRLAGLPDDPDVFAAAEQLRGRVALPADELHFESSLTGPIGSDARFSADADTRLASAERLLGRARQRVGGDPRWNVACAAVDLVRHHYSSAAARYREALDASANYPEARLGLGAAWALEAEIERHPLTRHRARLRAIAQFAAVPPSAPEYGEALYDRAIMLARVGRTDEAARCARGWLARDNGTAGEARMREIAGAAR